MTYCYMSFAALGIPAPSKNIANFAKVLSLREDLFSLACLLKSQHRGDNIGNPRCGFPAILIPVYSILNTNVSRGRLTLNNGVLVLNYGQLYENCAHHSYRFDTILHLYPIFLSFVGQGFPGKLVQEKRRGSGAAK